VLSLNFSFPKKKQTPILSTYILQLDMPYYTVSLVFTLGSKVSLLDAFVINNYLFHLLRRYLPLLRLLG